MPMRPISILVLIAVCAWPLAARADDGADRHAAAVALLERLHPADAVASMMPGIIGQLRTNLTHNDPDLVKQFDAFAPRLFAEGDAAKSELIDKIIDLYAETFTVEDLNGMAAFYASPIGQKMIDSQAVLNGKMVDVAREWGTKVAQKIAKEAADNLQGVQP